jgi:peptide/nickel transport system substrate-binding protein
MGTPFLLQIPSLSANLTSAESLNCLSPLKQSPAFIQTLAEWAIAFKARGMRRWLAFLFVLLLAVAAPGCRPQPEGSVKVIVIGDEPRMRDPAQGALDQSDAILVANVAQGLVRFDAGGNIVAGLAERWNLSDDGLSYIFRLATTEWPDGRKVTAQQIAKLLKRAIGPRSRNALSDPLGGVEDIVAMTDRVIEIRLSAPRPNLLALLAQPEMAVVRNGEGTGPFALSTDRKDKDELRLVRKVSIEDGDTSQTEEVLLKGAAAEEAVNAFVSGEADLVLGGTFADLPYARRAKLPRNSLRFDPASGLFGLVPVRSGGPLDNPAARRLLAQAIDRDNFVATMGVPGLTGRATLLEPGLDGIPDPVPPAWTGTAAAQRRPALVTEANRLFGTVKPAIRVAVPDTPGAPCCSTSCSGTGARSGLASKGQTAQPRPISGSSTWSRPLPPRHGSSASSAAGK